eukprot:5318486-Pyramimonas_sp.AAC.1
MPPLVEFGKHPSFLVHKCDFCQYGAPWKKATSIASWNAPLIPALNQSCRSRSHICTRSKQPHIILSGLAPGTSKKWTQVATPFPPKFALAAASSL